MNISLKGYKVIYGEKVLNALALINMWKRSPEKPENQEETISKPDRLVVLAIDTDGTMVVIDDEAWRFQFIPQVNKQVEK